MGVLVRNSTALGQTLGKPYTRAHEIGNLPRRVA